MSNRSLTPPERSDTHTQLVDAEDPPTDSEAERQSTPTQRKRRLDHDDQPYIPDVQRNVKDQTPKKRKTASTLASYVKSNVIREAVAVHGAPTEGHQPKCLISGVSDKMTILEFSHVMGGSTPSKEMDCLEWSWNRKYYSLNVDTRKNLQIIRVTLHRWFDMTKASNPVGWFWLPVDLDILSNMHATYVGNVFIFPVLPEARDKMNVRKDPESFYGRSCKFRYQLIPLSGMEASWSIKRYTGNALGPFDPNLIEHSAYPFTNLLPIELHVPYHFVIVNTGKKLRQLYGMDAINFERDFPFLLPTQKFVMTAVRNIYVAWMAAMPPTSFTEGAYGNKPKSAAGQTHLPGEAGSDGSPQGGGMPYGGKDEGGQAQDDAAGSFGAMGQQQAADESLAPWDSASCLKAFEPKDGGGQAQDDACGSFGAMMGQQQAAAESLTPWDSASCLKAFELADEGNEEDVDDSFVDDEDDEYEDEEFFEGLKQWASDVWTATHSDSASDSEVTLVGGTAAHVSCKSLDVPATLETPPLLSVQ
ncbi:uncharacterized protein LACBIDRAFT_294852 [Laccaria bicolor S238N-H82]|uniref:Predicted protein n=1 Tax=Laccaria bicolor (strain S238N-H82 / ATCC MYA-4686) TaxID=486041 RepID=B0DIT5_LACBS|nr:uncharacterized protein LACBIDRAFT_294852 [Laccaria bicolor S238N-H82]EDR05288.1 predicted protein [Laccaria bicolor S238N-H82]|eukprot:XP_001883846.1 predicted protein [Laccaria bicolor S238N-H82]